MKRGMGTFILSVMSLSYVMFGVKVPDILERIIHTSPEVHHATLKAVIKQLDSEIGALQVAQLLDGCASKRILLLQAQRNACIKLCDSLPVGDSARADERLVKILLMGLACEREFNRRPGDPKIWEEYKTLLMRDLNEPVSTQQAFLLDLLLNMIVITGENYAMVALSQEDQAQLKKYFDKIGEMQKEFQATQQTSSQQLKQSISNLGAQFQKQIADVATKRSSVAQQFSQELAYIQRLITTSVPPQEFLSNAISFDTVYTVSAMKTPSSSYTWRNVFKKGDWEFDPDLGGFIQRGSTGSQAQYIQQQLQADWLGKDGSCGIGSMSANCAEQNKIFTEYFSDQDAYQIQVEMTLINTAFPFLAGVVFNNARWISGSLERMNMYRLAGLYGSSKDGKKTVGFYVGQSAAGVLAPTTPMQAIASGSLSPIFVLSDDDVNQLGVDPSVFRITLTTSKTSVQAMLEKQTNGRWKTLINSNVDFDAKESELIFWYHGIGFVSPGSQTLFKIVSPQDLSYSKKQLNDFKQGLKK